MDPQWADIVKSTNISEILNGCRQNRTLYSILSIEDKLPLANVRQMRRDAYAQLEQQLARLPADFGAGRPLQGLLPPDVEALLNRLRQEGLPQVSLESIEKVRLYL